MTTQEQPNKFTITSMFLGSPISRPHEEMGRMTSQEPCFSRETVFPLVQRGLPCPFTISSAGTHYQQAARAICRGVFLPDSIPGTVDTFLPGFVFFSVTLNLAVIFH